MAEDPCFLELKILFLSLQEHGVLRVILARTVPKSQEIPVESSDDEYVAVDEGDDANAGPSNA